MEWISVKDRMPKKIGKVIWYHPATTGRTNHCEYLRIDIGDLPNRPASHWMPLPPATLPEPPQ